jgi:uncharacterized protein YecE (DUF72 family)
MRTLVGTSGYNYPEWKGTFYPDKMPAGKMLAYYAAQLPVVEINYTFYGRRRKTSRWAETTLRVHVRLKAPNALRTTPGTAVVSRWRSSRNDGRLG